MCSLGRLADDYLANWEHHATVRGMPRSRPTAENQSGDLVPPSYLLSLQKVENVDQHPDARRNAQLQLAYRMLEDIALVETDLVCAFVSDIANRVRSVEIPAAARQVLLTVGIDEVYHAFAAREFIEDMSKLTGIGPAPSLVPKECVFLSGVMEVRPHLPSEFWPDFQVIALCLAENALTEEVLGFTRTTAEGNPLHTLMREHFFDECRHAAFFRALLEYYWSHLDEQARGAIARILPLLFDAVYGSREKIEESERVLLVAAGFSLDVASRATSETWRKFDKRRHGMWHNNRRALEESHVLADGAVYDALVEGGWIDAADEADRMSRGSLAAKA